MCNSEAVKIKLKTNDGNKAKARDNNEAKEK